MRKRRSREGQALVEFALLGTVLITLVLGIFDFGRAYYTQVQIKNVLGDAGYYAIQHPKATQSDISAVIKSQLTTLDSSAFTITVSCPTSSTKQIRVVYQYSFIFSWIVPNAKVSLGDETSVPQIDTCQT